MRVLRFVLVLAVFVAAVAPVQAATQSTVRGAASAAKDVSTGVLSDVRRVGRVASFPVRHPKKSLHAVEKAGKGVALAGMDLFFAIIGPGVPR
jgi:hypothetical protein